MVLRMYLNPDFTKIALDNSSAANGRAAWEQKVLKETEHSVE